MFAHAYFPAAYFAPRYYPPAGAAPAPEQPLDGGHRPQSRKPQRRAAPPLPEIIAEVADEGLADLFAGLAEGVQRSLRERLERADAEMVAAGRDQDRQERQRVLAHKLRLMIDDERFLLAIRI
jgi:hypothetical protein